MDSKELHNKVCELASAFNDDTGRFFQLLEQALEAHQSAAQAVAEQSIHPFAEEVGEAVATLSQNFFDFSETMRNVYARQRGDAQRDYVPTRDDLVFRLFERWRRTDGHQGNGPRHREQIIAELEALFAPAAGACESEPKNVAAESKAWLMLDSNITDVLRIALPAEDQSMQMYATARLIMNLIERYLSK